MRWNGSPWSESDCGLKNTKKLGKGEGIIEGIEIKKINQRESEPEPANRQTARN